MEIKKIIDKVYDFSLKNTTLLPDVEILDNGIEDEFKKALMKGIIKKEIVMIPTEYKKGLFYDSATKEIVNNPTWNPAIIKFTMNFNGLKKNTYYKLSVSARNYKKYSRITDVTDDRSLYVTTNKNDLLINSDLSDIDETINICGVFKAYENSISINFKFGKIAISRITLEEVELFEDDIEADVEDIIIDHDRLIVVSASTFAVVSESVGLLGDYVPLIKMYGKGINLYFNRKDNTYIIERDNADDVVNSNLNSNRIIIDININKAIGDYVGMRTIKSSSELSPNTLKSGFIVFGFVNEKNEYVPLNEGLISIVINKII